MLGAGVGVEEGGGGDGVGAGVVAARDQLVSDFCVADEVDIFGHPLGVLVMSGCGGFVGTGLITGFLSATHCGKS